MEAEFFASATAMLRAAAAGIKYDHIAAAHGVTKSTVSNRVRRLALALQQVVGVLEVDEDTSPSASLLRRHQDAYLEALEHFRPAAVPAHFEPPQTLTPAQMELLLAKIQKHSHAPLRDKALLLALFSTGAKPLEIARLTVQDYMDAGGHVRTNSVLLAEIATNHANRPLQFNCPDTVAAIDTYLAERTVKRFALSTEHSFRGLDPESRLFLSRTGRPMKIGRPSNNKQYLVCKEMHEIYRRMFTHAGLVGLSTACARRMAASRMWEEGASSQDIGHALGVKCAAVHQLLRLRLEPSMPDNSANTHFQSPLRLSTMHSLASNEMKPDPEKLEGRSYTITPVSTASGNGWWLRIFVNGEEVGYRMFLARTANRTESMVWWDGLTNEERTACAAYDISATDAYQRHLLGVAYAEAETIACAWMDTRIPLAAE